jgi:hypothetical protein
MILSTRGRTATRAVSTAAPAFPLTACLSSRGSSGGSSGP